MGGHLINSGIHFVFCCRERCGDSDSQRSPQTQQLPERQREASAADPSWRSSSSSSQDASRGGEDAKNGGCSSGERAETADGDGGQEAKAGGGHEAETGGRHAEAARERGQEAASRHCQGTGEKIFSTMNL